MAEEPLEVVGGALWVAAAYACFEDHPSATLFALLGSAALVVVVSVHGLAAISRWVWIATAFGMAMCILGPPGGQTLTNVALVGALMG